MMQIKLEKCRNEGSELGLMARKKQVQGLVCLSSSGCCVALAARSHHGLAETCSSLARIRGDAGVLARGTVEQVFFPFS
jgi:hypothetical protein